MKILLGTKRLRVNPNNKLENFEKNHQQQVAYMVDVIYVLKKKISILKSK